MFGGSTQYNDTQVIELSKYMYSSRYNVCIEYELVSIFMNSRKYLWGTKFCEFVVIMEIVNTNYT